MPSLTELLTGVGVVLVVAMILAGLYTKNPSRAFIPLPRASAVHVVGHLSTYLIITQLWGKFRMTQWWENSFLFTAAILISLIAIGLLLNYRAYRVVTGNLSAIAEEGAARRLKYERFLMLIYVSDVLLSFTIFVVNYNSVVFYVSDAASLEKALDALADDARINAVLAVMLHAALQAMTFWIGLLPHRAQGERLFPGRALGILNFIASYKLILGSLLFTPLAVLCAMVRYRATERLLECPFLYLRSFSGRNTEWVYSSIIVRATRRYGTVVGLVPSRNHDESTSSLYTGLARLINRLLRARLLQVDDEEWQNWVLRALDRCSAVILDYTYNTDGLNWELEQCLAKIPRNRIFVLQEQNSFSPLPPEGVFMCRYTYDNAASKGARAMLHRWLEDISGSMRSG